MSIFFLAVRWYRTIFARHCRFELLVYPFVVVSEKVILCFSHGPRESLKKSQQQSGMSAFFFTVLITFTTQKKTVAMSPAYYFPFQYKFVASAWFSNALPRFTDGPCPCQHGYVDQSAITTIMIVLRDFSSSFNPIIISFPLFIFRLFFCLACVGECYP